MLGEGNNKVRDGWEDGNPGMEDGVHRITGNGSFLLKTTVYHSIVQNKWNDVNNRTLGKNKSCVVYQLMICLHNLI